MTERDHIEKLTLRERQLIRLASEGHTDTSIANRLAISPSTVKTYWERIRTKVGPYSRPELIAHIVRADAEAQIADLRTQNQILLDELQRLNQSSPSDGDAYYRQLIEDAPDAILIVGTKGLIEGANMEAEILLGYSEEELTGMHIKQLVPERLRPTHIEHMSHYLAEPHKMDMGAHHATPALHRTGHEVYISASLAPIETPHGRKVMCIFRAVRRGL